MSIEENTRLRDNLLQTIANFQVGMNLYMESWTEKFLRSLDEQGEFSK